MSQSADVQWSFKIERERIRKRLIEKHVFEARTTGLKGQNKLYIKMSGQDSNLSPPHRIADALRVEPQPPM